MYKRFYISAVACFGMIFIMQWQGGALKTGFSPLGIVDLELADNTQRLQELLMGWNIAMVKANIWLDFLFIVSYVLFLSIAAELSAMRWLQPYMKKAGLMMARLAYLAGILDIAENLLMLQSMAGNYTKASLQLTYYCAYSKFFLAGLILLYLLISIPVMVRKNKN